MDRTLSTIQHIIQRSRERKALPLAPTEADNCYLSGRSNEYQTKKVCKVLDKSPQAYYKSLKSDTPLRESELEFIVTS